MAVSSTVHFTTIPYKPHVPMLSKSNYSISINDRLVLSSEEYRTLLPHRKSFQLKVCWYQQVAVTWRSREDSRGLSVRPDQHVRTCVTVHLNLAARLQKLYPTPSFLCIASCVGYLIACSRYHHIIIFWWGGGGLFLLNIMKRQCFWFTLVCKSRSGVPKKKYWTWPIFFMRR